MRKEQIFIRAILYAFLAGAVFQDLTRDKIYNLWILPGLAAGLIMSATKGAASLGNAFLAVLIAFLVLLPVYLLKGIAAGDVKLIMATASFLSFQELYSCILYSFLVAGAISLLIIIFKKNKHKTIHFAVPVMAGAMIAIGGFV
ncbi:A24 family peptidase [Butyrivibrio sp. AE3009]|uniref:A24 family peptidase n=1 Tax=Butyrivibrio sp. AE3009 TaxID=1280666 RepID=UPI0003B442FB|nr:A24 family peptidase [Butyrivibrio sp. AE3009]